MPARQMHREFKWAQISHIKMLMSWDVKFSTLKLKISDTFDMAQNPTLTMDPGFFPDNSEGV